jgi:hypothetical protein
MAFCSALFNLEYWQGVADATELGTRVLRKPQPPDAVDPQLVTRAAAPNRLGG